MSYCFLSLSACFFIAYAIAPEIARAIAPIMAAGNTNEAPVVAPATPTAPVPVAPVAPPATLVPAAPPATLVPAAPIACVAPPVILVPMLVTFDGINLLNTFFNKLNNLPTFLYAI